MVQTFWDITAGNVVTWIILAAGFTASQYIAVKILGQRMDMFEKWKGEHERESNDRDKMLVRMDKTIVELVTLSKVAHQRLEMFESRKSWGKLQ